MNLRQAVLKAAFEGRLVWGVLAGNGGGQFESDTAAREILVARRKGIGATLVIRYRLPRE